MIVGKILPPVSHLRGHWGRGLGVVAVAFVLQLTCQGLLGELYECVKRELLLVNRLE